MKTIFIILGLSYLGSQAYALNAVCGIKEGSFAPGELIVTLKNKTHSKEKDSNTKLLKTKFSNKRISMEALYEADAEELNSIEKKIQYLSSVNQNTNLEFKRLMRKRDFSRTMQASSLSRSYVVKTHSDCKGLEKLMASLSQDQEIESVSLNLMFQLEATIDSYAAIADNALNSNLKQIKANDVWADTTGEGVIVTTIDSGLDYEHPDLSDNVAINKKEDSGSASIDDDRNGLVDDIYGYDFSVSDRNADGDTIDVVDKSDSDPKDDNGHGTHVAGIIAAEGLNTKGIVGVAPRVKILSVKVLDDNASSPFDRKSSASNIVKAIKYAVEKRGADVINMSIGAPISRDYLPSYASDMLYKTITTAIAKGVVVVVSAGNDNLDVTTADYSSCKNCFYYLPNIPGTISVGAVTDKDVRAYFSNYGAEVDISAPGYRIASTYKDGAYTYKSGTSMAAPHVSAAAALLLSINPRLSPSQVKNILMESGDVIVTDKPIGKRLNVLNAVAKVRG